ncbi:MAG: hypothetical protein NZ519_08690 [Bacteroidia bacterium]|nr:hypothetical protein [Bacteroidia bacterium]MDW8301620.1 hypothetical protein [Bacteroidia bacterium]
MLIVTVGRFCYAQQRSPVSANIDANWVVQIPNTNPVAKEYEASIKALNFTYEQAYRFFNWYSENLVIFQLDYINQKVKIILGTEYRPEWTAADWNNYLLQKANKARSKNVTF